MQKTIIQCDRCGAEIENLKEQSGNRILSLCSLPLRKEDNNGELCKNCVSELKKGLQGK